MGIRTQGRAVSAFIVLGVAVLAGSILIRTDTVEDVDERDPIVNWSARADTSGDIVFHLVSNIDGDATMEFRSPRRTGSITLKRGETLKIEVTMKLKRTAVERTMQCDITMNKSVLDKKRAIVRNNSRFDSVTCEATVRRFK